MGKVRRLRRGAVSRRARTQSERLPQVRTPPCDHARASGWRRSSMQEQRRESAPTLEPIDLLKFRDSKKYRDRLVRPQKATGEKDALIAMQRPAQRRSRWSRRHSSSRSWADRWARSSAKISRAPPNAASSSACRWCASRASGGARMQEGAVVADADGARRRPRWRACASGPAVHLGADRSDHGRRIREPRACSATSTSPSRRR